MNGWWYPTEWQGRCNNIKVLHKNRTDSASPNYCNKCSKTWLRKPNNYSAVKNIRTQFDYWDEGCLPTYKLDRKICPLCQ